MTTNLGIAGGLRTAGEPPGVDDWIERCRAAWAAKPALAGWYEAEIHRRIEARLAPGRTLHIGSGPGLYGRGRAGFVNADIGTQDGVDVRCDAHSLPFAAGAFANVVGIDVLHHLAEPGRALAEIGRVLAYGGTCLLVEPWAGPVGWLIYRYMHHESCHSVDEPWTAAFGRDKSAMDGNAWLPRALLSRRAHELGRHAPGLVVESMEAFGLFGYLATGGFRAWGMPAGVVRALSAIDASLPEPVLRAVALRVFFVLKRTDA